MTSKQINLEFLLQKTIADEIKDEVSGNQKVVIEQLLKIYDETGSKSFVVKLPNGEKVATFTIVEPKPKESVDEKQLIEWLEDNGYGDQVLTVEVPATTRKAVQAGALGAIGAELVDGNYVTPAGEIVEGIKQVPAAKPSSFQVRYEGGKDGRARVINAWRSGELAELDTGESLPQIGDAEPLHTEDEQDGEDHE